MRRFLHILTASLAVLLLASCTARDIAVVKPVDLGLKIEQVSGSKVLFSVSTSNENASYIFFTVGETHPNFDLPDKEAVEKYIQYLERVRDLSDARQDSPNAIRVPENSFSDFAFYRGNRTLKLKNLSDDTTFKLYLCQVNPKTHAPIGKVLVERFHTLDVIIKPMSFSFSAEKGVLTITPSDQERTYFWSVERTERIRKDYAGSYYFLYSLIDMYEDFGFVEPQLSQGTVTVAYDRDRFQEGERYCVSAIGYENGEINSEESNGFFVCRDGMLIESKD